MDAIQTFADALHAGAYPDALTAYRALDHAREPVGQATEALLRALTGDHAGAAAQIAACRDAELIEIIIRGERERAARWTDERAAGRLPTVTDASELAVYARMAVALLHGDARAINARLAADARAVRSGSGRLRLGPWSRHRDLRAGS